MSRALFGTDGVRGLAGEYPLDEAGAQAIGAAVAAHFAKPGDQVIIGCDTRESSDKIVKDLAHGLVAAGVNVVRVGVITTPGLAYLTREHDEFVAGIMVTASHNPYQYNGVKVFDYQGGKLSDATEEALNMLIEKGTPPQSASQGTVSENENLLAAYEDFLVNAAGGLKLDGLRVAVDCANGSAGAIAPQVFRRLGAQVTPLFTEPDGKNINAGCGATDTAALAKKVLDESLDLGVALDGDADRLVMVDSQGREANGDHLMYLLAVQNGLEGVVATVMSNVGFESSLKKKGIRLERVQVGDRYVLEGLQKTGFRLGGEQSGHIVFPDLLQTGDGILAAVQAVRALAASGKTLAMWHDEVALLPQALVNMPLDDKTKLSTPQVRQFLENQERALAGSGRLLIRPSGTEPLVRVMVEAPDAKRVASEIASGLEQLLNEAS